MSQHVNNKNPPSKQKKKRICNTPRLANAIKEIPAGQFFRLAFFLIFLCVSQHAFADFSIKDKFDAVGEFLISPWEKNALWVVIMGCALILLSLTLFWKSKWVYGILALIAAATLIYAPDIIYSWMPKRMQVHVDKTINLSTVK